MNLIEFANARKLKVEVLHELGLAEYEREGQKWVEIPYKKNGVKVNAKHRCLDEKKFYQDKDGEKIFYNFDCLYNENLKADPLYITEGELDAITLIQEGYLKTVSVPEGAPNEEMGGVGKKYAYLDDIVDVLRRQPEVILVVDADTNGTNLLNDLAKRIGKGKCKWVKYPKGCKDINETFMQYGLKGVQKSLETARFLDEDGVFSLYNLPPTKKLTIYETGHAVSNYFKFREGDFSVCTGIPSMGKTTLVNDLICSTLVHNPSLKVCFASFEQNPLEDHVPSLIKWFAGKGLGGASQAMSWIDKRFCFVTPSEKQMLEDEFSLTWFLEKARYAVDRMGCNIIVLDPWNELEHIPAANETMTEYVGWAIRTMKKFARSMAVHLMVIAHPTKQQKDTSGNFKIPTLYDISDSAHWFNKADLGIIVHRDENGTTVFKTAKSRYHDKIGRVGEIKLNFNNQTMSFSEW